MPLLSLPYELLFEVLKDVEFDLISDPIPCNRGTTTIRSVASTCKLLRSLAIRYIYATLRVTRLSDLEALPSIFASHKNIAGSVRHLAFGFPMDSVYSANKRPSENKARISTDHYREILRRCSHIRTLYVEAGSRYAFTECRLDSYGQHSDGMANLLVHISPECALGIDRLALKRFDLKQMFSQFCRLGDMSNLKVLGLMRCSGSLGNPLILWRSGLKLFPRLPSVQDFSFQLQLPTLEEAAETALGEHIALALPNVEILAFDTSMHCIYGILKTYAKTSSEIKELELEPPLRDCSQTRPNLSGIHLCDPIAALSPHLEKFHVCIGRKHWKSTLPPQNVRRQMAPVTGAVI